MTELPQVDFYILNNNRPPEMLTCQLAHKANEQGLKVQILARDEAMARAIDERLWTFNDISFIPHALVDSSDSDSVPVLISWTQPAPSHSDVLMNLRRECPADPERFSRIIEIVETDEESRQYGRERFRNYRNRGYDPGTHTIDQAHDRFRARR